MFQPGDDVIVDFDGCDHDGVIDRVHTEWAFCTIAIDPDADYGSGTERLAPHQTVCVPVERISPR